MHAVEQMEAAGLEHVVIDLCKKIDKTKYTVCILCTRYCDPDYKKMISDLGIPLYMINKTKKIDLLFYSKAAALLNDLKIDILHIHSAPFDFSICALFSKVRTTIFTAHGMPIFLDFISNCQNLLGLNYVDRIVTVSDEIRDDFNKRLKIPARKFEIIKNGVDLSIFKPNRNKSKAKALKQVIGIPPEAFVIASVGRLEVVKNYDMLIRAFKKLLSTTVVPIHLALIGDGNLRKELGDLSQNLDIAEQVSFLGSRDDVAEILDIVDVFVLTSLTEGTSISVLEAQAKGIPTLASNVGGNGQIISHGVNGFLFPVNDEEAFCGYMIQLINDKALHKKVADNSRQAAHGFDIDQVITRYEKIYSQYATT